MKNRVHIQKESIQVEELLSEFKRKDCGAHVVFDGTVRSQNKGQEVEYLEFEAYHSMALQEMQRLIDRATEKYELKDALMVHREGKVNLGETAVLIVVAGVHRNEAFEACRFLIDELKITVPIWKKEVYSNGFVWISAHP